MFSFISVCGVVEISGDENRTPATGLKELERMPKKCDFQTYLNLVGSCSSEFCCPCLFPASAFAHQTNFCCRRHYCLLSSILGQRVEICHLLSTKQVLRARSVIYYLRSKSIALRSVIYCLRNKPCARDLPSILRGKHCAPRSIIFLRGKHCTPRSLIYEARAPFPSKMQALRAESAICIAEKCHLQNESSELRFIGIGCRVDWIGLSWVLGREKFQLVWKIL